MAFTSYATLQTALADQLARSDLTTQIPDFITLFEAEANRELFRMRLNETSTSLTPSAGSVALPSDYMGWRRVTWTGNPLGDLEYVHPAMLRAYYASTPTGTPRLFTIEGSNLLIRPLDTTALDFDYFAKPAALSSSLNWLMTNHPDAYWFGSLEQAYLWIKDYDQAAPWSAKKAAVYSSIKTQNFRQQGAMQIRVAGPTP